MEHLHTLLSPLYLRPLFSVWCFSWPHSLNEEGHNNTRTNSATQASALRLCPSVEVKQHTLMMRMVVLVVWATSSPITHTYIRPEEAAPARARARHTRTMECVCPGFGGGLLRTMQTQISSTSRMTFFACTTQIEDDIAVFSSFCFCSTRQHSHVDAAGPSSTRS